MVEIQVTVLLVSGVLLFISFMGFMGALRENVYFLTWYIRGIRVLVILNGLFILGSFFIPMAGSSSVNSVFTIDLIVSYRDNPDYARLVDYAQAFFECCGVTSERYRDWDHNIYFNCSKYNPSTERCSVPASCCKRQEGERLDIETRLKHRFCGRGVLNVPEQEAWRKIYTRNCVDAMVTYLRSNTIMMIVVGTVLSVTLAVLRKMATTVHDEVISLTRLYDRYYKRMATGCRPSLARREALDEVAAARSRLVTREAKPGAEYPANRQSPEATWRPSPAYDHMVGRPSVDAGPPLDKSPSVTSAAAPNAGDQPKPAPRPSAP
ncbi:tetraspanin-33-like [Amblyomma americanum]